MYKAIAALVPAFHLPVFQRVFLRKSVELHREVVKAGDACVLKHIVAEERRAYALPVSVAYAELPADCLEFLAVGGVFESERFIVNVITEAQPYGLAFERLANI